MNSIVYNSIRILRPRQWIKNLAIFAAITFNEKLFDFVILEKVIIGFFVFCGLSSAIYIFNDILDSNRDKLHPFKKFRPIAHGDLPVNIAIFLALTLIIISLWIGLFVSFGFFVLTVIYLFIQLLYSLVFKNIAIIDILILASGYILRVYGGEFASGFHISVWLLLTTISISLLLAVGKRRSELTLLNKFHRTKVQTTRKSLTRYSEKLLDIYASIFATSTFITYSLFTFLENESGFKISLSLLMPEFLPSFLNRKWLMITIIPVVYGLMRYLEDVYERDEGESPEKILLGDKPLLYTVIIWILLVISILYIIGG